MKKEFKIRTMGFGELAVLYFPSLQYGSACNSLNKWLKNHPTLLDQLKSTGYKKRQRVFTPLQVCYIINALGPP